MLLQTFTALAAVVLKVTCLIYSAVYSSGTPLEYSTVLLCYVLWYYVSVFSMTSLMLQKQSFAC